MPTRPEAGAVLLIEQAAQRALDQVRELVDTLRLPEVDNTATDGSTSTYERAPFGTGDAQFRELIDVFATSTHAHVSLDVRDVELSTPGWLAVQRVCAEALTNIRRHAADATDVQIQLTPQTTGIRLSVANNGTSGRGIGGGTGSGLVGSRERVELLGGSFTAAREPDGWWRVTAQLPSGASIERRRSTR